MTITLRTTKGSPLTIAELDGNFTDLDGRLIVVEDGQTSVRSIDEIVQVGNSLVVQYTDASEDGPFTFEVTITWRGEWVALENYLQNDLVTANGIVYIVLQAHTAGSEFDPDANDTSGNFYAVFLEVPGLTIPAGGDAGTVLAKVSATDYDYQWTNQGMPAGGTTGQFLTKASNDDYDTEWSAVAASTVFEITSTTFTLSSLSYASGYFRTTHVSGCTITIPVDSDVDFDIGTEIEFRQSSSGSIIFIGDSSTAESATINGIDGYENATDLEGSVVTIKKAGANSWDLWGLVTPSSA